jgi:hypothetical protein
MTKDDYDLDNIIKKSFEEAIEYFNKNGIKIEGLRLRIVKSLWSFYDRFIYLLIILVFICTILYYEVDIPIRYLLIVFIIAFFIAVGCLLCVYQRNLGLYFPDKKIFIIKKQLEKTVNRILEDLSYHNIKDSSVSSIKLSRNSIVLYPFYINMKKDIVNDIIKNTTDIVVIHETAHYIFGINEWKTSAFEYLVYFYKNEFYNYPEVYKIMEENIKICKSYVEENKRLNIYELGRCYGNIIIHKNKQSTNINIKNIIEEIKNLSEKDIINTIKNYIIK